MGIGDRIAKVSCIAPNMAPSRTGQHTACCTWSVGSMTHILLQHMVCTVRCTFLRISRGCTGRRTSHCRAGMVLRRDREQSRHACSWYSHGHMADGICHDLPSRSPYPRVTDNCGICPCKHDHRAAVIRTPQRRCRTGSWYRHDMALRPCARTQALCARP